MSSKDKLKLLKTLTASRANKSSKEFLDKELELAAESQVYDLVDENQFRERNRKELLRDDFVVDDDGKGYINKGIDEWDARYQEDDYSDFDDADAEIRVKAQRVKSTKPNVISDMINNVQKSRAAVSVQKKPKKINADEFDDILEQFDSEIVSAQPKSSTLITGGMNGFNSEKRSRPLGTPAVQNKKPKLDDSFDNIKEVSSMDSSPLKFKSKLQQRAVNTDSVDEPGLNNVANNIQSSPVATKPRSSPLKNEVFVIDDLPSTSNASFDDNDSDDDIQFGRRTVKTVASDRKVTFTTAVPNSSSPHVIAHGTPFDQNMQIAGSGIAQVAVSGQLGSVYTEDSIVDGTDNSFKMFWADFTELDSTLLLFGKVKTKHGKFISAMVQVAGLHRELYFLPREGKTTMEVHEEIIPLLLDKYGLDNIRAKPTIKKYAFELPGIPKEAEYLKVLLPYNTPKCKNMTIPADLSGDTFYHVFGGGTNIFESFVLQQKIMGPSWLNIRNGDFNELQNASHCAIDVFISNPQDIVPIQEKLEAPPLNCVSLAVQTIMNPKENKQELVSITMTNYDALPQEKPIPDTIKPNEVVTLVRPLVGSTFPPGLSTLSKKELPGMVRMFNNEKAMLNCLCAMMKRNDPDVIIGHKLESLTLDVLSHRAFELEVQTFSSFGRRVRKSWPDNFGKKNANLVKFHVRDIFSGRLLCDVSNEMGQSLTQKCQNWELTEMYQVACQKDHKAIEINFNDVRFQEDVSLFVLALKENIFASKIAAEIAFRIQILPLTKQLTNLAGNAWCQTLGGTRAGRNEFILLHEFNRSNYIVPDKETKQMRNSKQHKANETTTSNDGNQTSASNKKPKYQGGLVFEPEKGLHKNYVLVMDFNSLYPSIIQEFNICFTTVERDPGDIEQLPEVPPSGIVQGVLPKLLANLVQRRREVKKLMKLEIDPQKKAECDIRQQALKLTANSMYGCLGYVNSRFYAKPLAMLVTNKGREILMNTRQLAESLALSVIYGDTDSVMIDTGCDNYKESVNIGENFKKLVNERYKLLEIDIDNVFKKLLLHAKKKYAALNVGFDKLGNETSSLEVKGLDMRRREYCPLSKEVSTQVLNTILSDKDLESALQEVYEFMEEIRSKIENNEIRVDKYKINTKLSKDPKSYPNGKSMPAVQVALKMREAGKVIKAGSVITFVITKGPQGKDSTDSSNSSPADRAYPLHDVMNKRNELAPDPKYYLEKQIFAPVERILERVESFDIVRLSESLGLDSRRYINRVGSGGELNGGSSSNLQPLESTISDTERFKDTEWLDITCSICQHKFPFGGITASNHYQWTYNGLQCKHCDHLFSLIELTCQLERSIRSHISLYYAGWLLCDDPTCNNLTRQISVFGKRCLNENCTGVMRYRYSDKKLYNQLLYFDSLFDIEKNKKQELKPLYLPNDADIPTDLLNSSQIAALSEQNRETFNINRSVVQKYLDQCGRRYVDMGDIFDFMKA
ncbi:DNA-directed DNA polymerase alpha catalytic subunit POL1 Ecym_5409 [Eremothecium cymbalariae DBVPG|uniref:DNA polymerase n=1 Tax=Eremothecium cymbalariae (strain CBS 270.75 / DBVPG 7215 / KCTC 17166 / NRRL Y-17582) TaxID=931890 RepID=I6NDM1_ERECY|nr:hypothetical protein Ecym_5409 [Eremothecium cymbalariae DBVPG\